MKTVADQTLQGNCAEVTDQLLWSTLGGNAVSAKLLFALADGQIDIEEAGTLQRLHSRASALAAEPEWQLEVSEAEAETSFGQREPEG